MMIERVTRRACRLIADVRPGETPMAALLALNAFLLLMAYSCIKPVREALILTHAGGAEYKAYMAGATALILLVAVPLYSRASRGLARNRLVAGTTVFFAAHLLTFYIAGLSMGSTLSFGLAFYLWIAVFNMMIVTQFWAYASDVYPEEAGRRLFPLLGFGASLGAVAGAALARPLIAQLGTLAMMPLGAGLLIAAAGVAQWVHAHDVRHAATAGLKAAATSAVGGHTGEAFHAVITNRYLLYIAAFSLLFTLVKTNGDYMMARAVEDAANKAVAAGTLQPSQVQNYIGGVFATFTFWIDIVSLALQGLAVSRVVTYLGFGAGFYALPIVALGDAALMSMWPVLTVVRIGKTAESAVDYSLNNTMRHMLWLPTARRAKYLAKQATDTIFVRAGDIASAAMIFAAGRLGLPPRAVPAGNLCLIGVWFTLAAAILRERRRLLEPSARAHREASRRGIDWARRTGLIAALRKRGKADGERAPFARPALDGDRPLMTIDDPLREGES